MITFKEYLQEVTEKDPRHVNDPAKPEDHTVEEAVRIFKERCHDWKMPKFPLYRFRGYDKRGPSSRSTRKRQSRSIAGSTNIQNYLSNFGWTGFPDRGSSTFTSTQPTSVFNHLEQYAIFPYNGSKMAVTTTAKDFNFIKIGGFFELRYVPSELRSFLMEHNIPVQPGLSDDAFLEHLATLRSHVKKLEKAEIPRMPKDLADKELAHIMKDPHFEFWMNLEKYLTPEAMGCVSCTPRTFDFEWIENLHEVWFEGRYLAIHMDDFDDFLDALRK